jgi:hypothetical protein
MRILVLSDSHGAVENMARCVDLVEPDHILHLGDCLRDAEALHRRYPNIPLDAVAGNCDWALDAPTERLLELAGHRILMMHGHTHGDVKHSDMASRYAAAEAGAEVLLYGHTHRPLVDKAGELWVMNPGTCEYGGKLTYGVITATRDKLECATFRL